MGSVNLMVPQFPISYREMLIGSRFLKTKILPIATISTLLRLGQQVFSSVPVMNIGSGPAGAAVDCIKDVATYEVVEFCQLVDVRRRK